MEIKKVIILGASPDPARFSFRAANALADRMHDIVLIGLKQGMVRGVNILDIRTQPFIDNVDTITLYMNPRNQQPYYDYILRLKPRRIIFNPGTENNQLSELALKHHIEVVNDCTLVMLGTNSF
jgi:predicted CoA-binding protein